MPDSFLSLVSNYLYNTYKDNIQNCCIILPNKRASVFLKQNLAAKYNKTIWLPKIYNAEEFITDLSGLDIIENVEQICYLYESYTNVFADAAEPFDKFAKWGQLMLQDFNEIDRYLADATKIYANLKDIKEIENWSLNVESLSITQEEYIFFMTKIGNVYEIFVNNLLNDNKAYQGLAYKIAAKKIQNSKIATDYLSFIICGFNALNAAEIKIFDFLDKSKKADFIWDTDAYYLSNKWQESGVFLRKNFELFPKKQPNFISDYYSSNQKNITIVSIPKQVGQVIYAKQKIEEIVQKNESLNSVAIVLANEELLWPLLKVLPINNVNDINITIEPPIQHSTAYVTAALLIDYQIKVVDQKNTSIYYKDILHILKGIYIKQYIHLLDSTINFDDLIKSITSQNASYLSLNRLEKTLDSKFKILKYFLFPSKSVYEFCDLLINFFARLIAEEKKMDLNAEQFLQLQLMTELQQQFKTIKNIVSKVNYLSNFSNLKYLFKQIVVNNSTAFIGKPTSGLQIMGVLETRTLDFETILFLGVNEGILPSGKSLNSFLPNDLKRAFNLPLYTEKDAIYAYHFYRLLQRSKNIDITYDSNTDNFGKGEKSRFITQLIYEAKQLPNIKIFEKTAIDSKISQSINPDFVIDINQPLTHKIKNRISPNSEFTGLSPSSLITLKDCALKFYFKYLLNLPEEDKIEEYAEANTMGTILHNSLEELYKPFLNQKLNEHDLNKQKYFIDSIVNTVYKNIFKSSELSGKNILQEQVIISYIKKYLNYETQFIKNNHNITLKHLEYTLQKDIAIEHNNEIIAVRIKGKVDRIDEQNGDIYIYDYKLSSSSNDKFTFDSFELLFTNKNYDKQLQLFIYAWLYYRCFNISPKKIIPVILPFKPFTPKGKFIIDADTKKTLTFTEDILQNFEQELKTFIINNLLSLSNFNQTNEIEICQYCGFKIACNR
ncbi:MAG: PD-(D/E)XK nuclease family protein [Bacteroidetes bacterium]|nr:PD-(D/E)XK nuclease family protein [Bacteroidota bacterium]